MMTAPSVEHKMDQFDIESRERLVRVEEGINNLADILKSCDSPEMKQDITNLKGTQKWIRWVSKTVIGGAILSTIGYIVT